MKKKISAILFGLLFLVGFGILVYPTVSNQWNTYRQSQLISNYQSVVQDMTPEDFTQEWERAEAFNATITQNNLYSDVFGESTTDLQSTEYWKVLNEAGDGIMGYLSIPKINIKLAIYHGTADDVLQTGVGHLNGTKLPIGGESTHCVVAAHRGLPSAKLFTDIDQLRNLISGGFIMAIIDLTKENFQAEITKSDKPVLVDFWAVWCGPCQMMAPILHELEAEMPDVQIGKVNVDEQMDLARQFRVVSIPTLIIFKNGQEVQRMVGVTSKEELKDALK